MSENAKTICTGVAVVAAIIIGLVVYSYDSLEPREIGILYNSIDKSIDRTPYTGGAHLVGLFNSFIHFPGGYELIEFSSNPSSKNDPLGARTSDGVTVTLSLSFQYQLIKAELAELYEQSNTNYESTFINIARDTLLQSAAVYQANQYWNDRANISALMLENMNIALKEAHANCVSLQLLEISIPSNLEGKIVDTQVEKQLSSTKVFEREAELIRQDIDILNSQCDQNITAITASANAEAYYIVKVAEAAARKRAIDMQASVYGFTISGLVFNNTEFTEYIYLRSIENQKNATITVGLESAVIQITNS